MRIFSYKSFGSCSGPLESYISYCGRYRSTIDYILLPNCLSDNIVSAKTFDLHADNTSDHLPIEVCLSYPDKSVNNAPEDNIDISESTLKVHWYKFSPDEVNEKYSIPLLRDLQHLFLDSFDTTENVVTECYNLLQVHSFVLVSKPTLKRKNKNKNTVYVKLPSDVQAARHVVKVDLIFGNNRIFLIMVKFMMSIGLNAENTENTCANS